jgi:hypothetical protein
MDELDLLTFLTEASVRPSLTIPLNQSLLSKSSAFNVKPHPVKIYTLYHNSILKLYHEIIGFIP